LPLSDVNYIDLACYVLRRRPIIVTFG